MKKIQKSPEPRNLTEFRLQNRNANWDAVHSNPVYQTIVRTAWQDQGDLCAFCERIPSPRDKGIEHFLQKSATPQGQNWSTDWQNMLAVCKGGELTSDQDPLPQNLSCDKHKNHWVNKKQLPADCEGYLLNPLMIDAFNQLFLFNPQTGELNVNYVGCQSHPVLSPNYLTPNTNAGLAENTLKALNLNCPRLCRERKILWNEVQKGLAQYRQQGNKAKYAKQKLAERYFSRKWPAYFTTLRIILKPVADQHLQTIHYQG